MEHSRCQAAVKVRARKKTQVIVTARNVAAMADARVVGWAQASGPVLVLNQRSMARKLPCSPPQATNVQLAPCHRPPSSMVIIRLTEVRFAPRRLAPRPI